MHSLCGFPCQLHKHVVRLAFRATAKIITFTSDRQPIQGWRGGGESVQRTAVSIGVGQGGGNVKGVYRKHDSQLLSRLATPFPLAWMSQCIYLSNKQQVLKNTL